MEEFQHSYSRLCKESGSEPQETVLQQLQELPRGRLDLATQSLTVDTCRALGKLLQKEELHCCSRGCVPTPLCGFWI